MPRKCEAFRTFRINIEGIGYSLVQILPIHSYRTSGLRLSIRLRTVKANVRFRRQCGQFERLEVYSSRLLSQKDAK